MSNLKAKMHQNLFPMGVLTALPGLLAGSKGPTCKKKEGRRGKGREGPHPCVGIEGLRMVHLALSATTSPYATYVAYVAIILSIWNRLLTSTMLN